MRIFIIRHGESLATLDPSLFSRVEPSTVPLSQWGYEQSLEAGKAVADYYRKHSIAAPKLTLYYSPFTRIAQSKDGFMEGIKPSHIAHQIETHKEPALVERNHGEFDGLGPEAQCAKDPETYRLLHEGTSEQKFKTKMPKGESLEDVQKRLALFIERVTSTASHDQDIVIITHGANVRCLEDILHSHQTPYGASWLVESSPPETGDVILIHRDRERPLTNTRSEVLHQGKKRPAHLPENHKTSAYSPSSGCGGDMATPGGRW